MLEDKNTEFKREYVEDTKNYPRMKCEIIRSFLMLLKP